jgi:two-component system response regulator FixJ
VVDDDDGLREAIAWLLDGERIDVVAVASAAEFLHAYERRDVPSCMLLDVRIPDMDGLELQRRMAEEGITMPVILLTAYATVPLAVQAMRSGAHDVIEKPVDAKTLVGKVRDALLVDRQTSGARVQRAQTTARNESLTQREREVLDGVVAGKPSKVIANELGISPRTVDVHRTNLMKKMGATTVADLVRAVVAARSTR